MHNISIRKAVLSLVLTAGFFGINVTGIAADSPPPLPFHAAEGCGGVFATHMAYLVNPEGGPIGLPGVGSIYVDFGHGRNLWSFTATETLWGRLELGYAYMSFNMGDLPDDIAAATGIRVSKDAVTMHNVNARLMVVKEGSWDQKWMPAITVGAHYKDNEAVDTLDSELAGTLTGIGIDDSDGVDFTLQATKMITSFKMPLIATLGLRATKGAHVGLLGFTDDYTTVVEGSLCAFLPRNIIFGLEYRQKPNEYTAVPGLIEGEDDWMTACLGYIVNPHMTAAIGYARFGDVLNHEANDSIGVALKWEM